MAALLAFIQAPVVVAVGVLVLAAVAIILTVLVITAVTVLQPIIDYITKPVPGFLGRAIRWVTRPVTGTVQRWYREWMNALSRKAFMAQGALSLLMDNIAWDIQHVAGTLGDMSEQIYTALWTLNHETIPRKIATALVPLRNQLTRHTQRLDALEDLNQRVAVEVGDTLRALPWGVPGGYVTNWATFLGRFVQLWEHYWNVTRAQLNTLLGETLPELRDDVADLGRRLDVNIDARLDALAGRIGSLETWRENVVEPRLDALTAAVDALATEIFDPGVGGLTALLERVIALERRVDVEIPARFDLIEQGLAQLRTELEQGIATGLETFRARIEDLERLANVVIPARLDLLEQGLAQLRTELEQGIAAGLGAFGDRIDALELEVFTAIPQRIAGMQLAIDTLAAEVFTEVGAGLTALTERIVALEARVETFVLPAIEELRVRVDAIELQIGTLILPQIELLQRAQAELRADITNNIIPRIGRIEGILEPVAFAALIVATLRNALPQLFCRNVTDTASRVCAQDENLWAQLLAGTLVFALALNPREIAEAGTALTGILGGVIAETVDH